MDEGTTRAYLEGSEGEEEVLEEIDKARQLGVSGVPFFVIDGPGEQPSWVGCMRHHRLLECSPPSSRSTLVRIQPQSHTPTHTRPRFHPPASMVSREAALRVQRRCWVGRIDRNVRRSRR